MGDFFKPTVGWAGDVTPYYKDGVFHLFDLVDRRESPQDYTNAIAHGPDGPLQWHHLTTNDFVHYEDHGPILPQGKIDEQDYSVGTGSVIERNGIFHLFHTGINEQLPVQQKIIHATSKDLYHWQKDKEFLLCADKKRYEKNDWRDPFVFWNENRNEYWMLIAARFKSGPDLRRGCTALAASKDLSSWELREPFWASWLYYTHECPDLFKMGDWWYFVFSTFSHQFETHYRMSKSLEGPWICPKIDTFDTRAFYAAKTASGGSRRFIFGWNPTRENDSDQGQWQWGGNLVVHEVLQDADGQLKVDLPDEIERSFPLPGRVDPVFRLGKGIREAGQYTLDGTQGFSWLDLGDLDVDEGILLRARLSFSEGTHNFGLILRSDIEQGDHYQLRFEPHRNRMVFDHFPRKGDMPYMLERPLDLRPRKIFDIKTILCRSIVETYVDHSMALSARAYHNANRCCGFFAAEGTLRIHEIKVQ